MPKILLFAGTTEGRQLAEFLTESPATVYICVASQYGADLLPKADHFHILTGRLDQGDMQKLMTEEAFDLVLDATHPYADLVTANVRAAAGAAGIPLMRVLRPGIGKACGDTAKDVDEACRLLSKTTGPVFLTTGSKNLAQFMTLPHAAERLFVRVLPSAQVIEDCKAMGLPSAHIFCMQGPFDTAMNVATIRHIRRIWCSENEALDADPAADPLTLVSKQSGKTGGFEEKLEAAQLTGARLLTIGLPDTPEDQGINPEEAISQLRSLLKMDRPLPHVALIGMGMSANHLTLEADRLLKDCHMIIGAGRMLEAVAGYGKPSYKSYNYDEITELILNHPAYSRFCVLFSGDIGFYSGAASLRSRLEGKNVVLQAVSGISSPAHFMNLLGKSWEKAAFISCHGQKANIISELRVHRQIVSLLGKPSDVSEICRKLIDYHMADTLVCVASDLGSPEECIVRGRACDFTNRLFPALSVVYLEIQDKKPLSLQFGLPDDRFVRGKVPMTKSEVRSVILSKLALHAGATFYDIGAGTGSIAIEAARLVPDGQVYAIERNEAGLALIRENALALGTDNLTIVSGTAPEALEELPAPSHAFVGGSGGRIEAIFELLYRKNPEVRIVISAIALETVGQLSALADKLGLAEPEIIQLQVSRSKKAGPYHLMEGLNPVYIASFTPK